MRGKVRLKQDAVKRWSIVLQIANPARTEGNNGREKLAGEMVLANQKQWGRRRSAAISRSGQSSGGN